MLTLTDQVSNFVATLARSTSSLSVSCSSVPLPYLSFASLSVKLERDV